MPATLVKSNIRRSKSSIAFGTLKRAADTKVVINQTLEFEDQFGSLYDLTKTNAALQPPFNPLMLKSICTRNNILMQCIHAMETNVDGTGYEIADDSQEGQPKGIDPKAQLALQAANGPGAAAGGGDSPTSVDPLKLLDHVKSAITGQPGKKPANGAATATNGSTDPTVAAAGVAASLEASGKPKTALPFTNAKKPDGSQDTIPSDTGPDDLSTDTPEEAAEKSMLDAFFKEPFPNESFIQIRRKLRVDLEATGNGYLEVIRNLDDEVVFLRWLDTSTMRLIKLDRPVLVEKTIERGDKTFTASVWERQRRFVQRVGTSYIYFKEFGVERELDRDTGSWIVDTDPKNKTGFPASGAASPNNDAASNSTAMLTLKGTAQDRIDGKGGNKDSGKVDGASPGKTSTLDAQKFGSGKGQPGGGPKVNLASEVIHFIVDRDTVTPYGIPRWINNLPAVLGSRKAEEFNLEFFDAGGLPPAIIFVQGGALAETVKTQLLAYLSGGTKNKHRGAVVEAQSSSGSLDSAGQVKVTVERFGDNRANGTDSMFQVYDDKSEQHVRGAFRLPAIFLGKAQDYNFATALTAVMVTEAQVFAPERTEFDEKINHTIVRSLGAKKYKFKSLPVTLKNTDLQLKAMDLVATKIDGQDLIDAINQITGLTLSYSPTADKASQALGLAQAAKAAAGAMPPSPAPNPFAPKVGSPFGGASAGGGSSSGGGGQGPVSSVAMKEELSPNDIVLLAGEWANAIGLSDGPRLEREVRRAIVLKVEALSKDEKRLFNSALASSTFARSSFDHEGLAELAGACVGLMDHPH